jgi:hypothetical protein
LLTFIFEKAEFAELLDGVVAKVALLELLLSDEFTESASDDGKQFLALFQGDIVLVGFKEVAVAHYVVVEDPIVAQLHHLFLRPLEGFRCIALLDTHEVSNHQYFLVHIRVLEHLSLFVLDVDSKHVNLVTLALLLEVDELFVLAQQGTHLAQHLGEGGFLLLDVGLQLLRELEHAVQH